MKNRDVNPYDTIQVSKIRKRNAAFRHARRIVASWPKWKQDVGYPPLSNVRGRR